jgi:hypothetical protein
MRTPFGLDCPHFYGDYYRGKHHEECRLLDSVGGSIVWKVDLCKTCPVPSITRANACPTLILSASIKKGILGLGKHVEVKAFCSRSQTEVKAPAIGCGLCHPIPDVFSSKKK